VIQAQGRTLLKLADRMCVAASSSNGPAPEISLMVRANSPGSLRKAVTEPMSLALR